MHRKNTKGIEDPIAGYDLYQEDILNGMNYLEQMIGEIDNYPDKSLFFQDPRVTEGWLYMVRLIEKTGNRGIPKDDIEWELHTETYVASLLTRRNLFLRYKKLYKEYYNPFSELVSGYSGWLEGDCISLEASKALIADQYSPVTEVQVDTRKFLEELNNKSMEARYFVYKALSDIFNILSAVMNRGGQIVIDQNPSVEDFKQALEDDIRGWHLSFGKQIFRKMKEEMNRHFKNRLTDPYTPELWGEMLRADEDALKMAMRQVLAISEDAKQEHWGEDMKKQMDENGELMRRIYSSCYTDELIDFGKDECVESFVELLTHDNLDMFYDIIVRRNLIQCEMYPELKNEYEVWLKNSDEKKSADQGSDEGGHTGLDEAHHSKLNEIIGFMEKGNMKQPATSDNIKLLLNTVFGRDQSLLEEGDKVLCEKMWTLVDGGRGNRTEIVSANIAGFLAEENLLIGTPNEISNDLFGKNNNQSNNINKGKSNNCSQSFTAVIPFLKKYIIKIVRSN